MSTPKPVYSRPSDEDTAPVPKKRKRHRKRAHRNKSVHTTDTLAAAQVKEIAEHDPLHEDDGVAFHDPTTTGDRHKRNRRTHKREKRRARELRAENELLHRRLAAIYDALTLD